MSYILQALRKSEQERELAAQEPSAKVLEHSKEPEDGEAAERIASEDEKMADVKIFPVAVFGWLGGFIVTLLIISGVVQYQLGKQGSDTLKTDNQEASNQEAVITPVEPKFVEAVANTSDLPATVSATTSTSTSTSTSTPISITPPMPVEQATQAMQSLVPLIDISSHIYSSLPERRSIVVNGARLVEGDFITPAAQVKEITHQGMVIAVDGQSLMIDRSRGWSR